MGASPVQSHRDLEVWQVGIELVDAVYGVSTEWPKHEMYGLTSQARRAAVSVPANIAEGNGKGTTKDYLRYLDNAYGSLMELDTHVHIARRRDYLSEPDETRVTTLITRIAKMLNALSRSLKRRLSEV